MIPDLIFPSDGPPLLHNPRVVTFDPPLVCHQGEQVQVKLSITDESVTLIDAKVVPAMLTDAELRAEVISMVKHYSEGIRIGELENELDFKGLKFERASLRAAVWSLIAIRKLDISPNNISTIHTPQE